MSQGFLSEEKACGVEQREKSQTVTLKKTWGSGAEKQVALQDACMVQKNREKVQIYSMYSKFS